MKQKIIIRNIPVILWGEKSDCLFIAVHGNQSHKEDDIISVFAECAISKGYQVLSFDLPDHGDRRAENIPCKVQNAMQDLAAVMSYAKTLSKNISVFACSMGAYFSLLSYKDESLKQALFLSPVVNMERLIQNMMVWFHVSEEQLQAEQEIVTPVGLVMYWDYYCYVKEHPIEKWNAPTATLYGTKDDTVERETIDAFTKQFRAELSIIENGEHYFHTPEQLLYFSEWCKNVMH
ncbi:MAG: alpha/beta hydrolase [Treponema sp.]|jgi:alpha-beta hydrolase superfamily lysophospholipase|nr:alpha/beta hydrolase [Treponema sp.]